MLLHAAHKRSLQGRPRRAAGRYAETPRTAGTRVASNAPRPNGSFFHLKRSVGHHAPPTCTSYFFFFPFPLPFLAAFGLSGARTT